MLVVDSREYGPLRARVLEAIPTAQVEYLPSGDYLFFDQDGHSLAIERKEIKDLLHSLAQRKLKRQLQGLAQFDRGILLIEGNWTVKPNGTLFVHNVRSSWQPQSIQAILLAVQEQTGAKVLHVANFTETILTLRMLERRAEAGCFWKGDTTDGQTDQAA